MTEANKDFEQKIKAHEERISKWDADNLPSVDDEALNGITKGELAKQIYGKMEFDAALPSLWLKKMEEGYPGLRGQVVWVYPDKNSSGEPGPLTKEAKAYLAKKTESVNPEIEHMRLISGITEAKAGQVDNEAAKELFIYIDQNEETFENLYMSAIKNLSKKKKNNTYDNSLAKGVFKNLVEIAAKAYAKDYGNASEWGSIFTTATRAIVAEKLVSKFEDEFSERKYPFMK